MVELVLGIAIVALWRLAVNAHHRGLAQQRVAVNWTKQTVTPMPPPWDDRPPITLAQALEWVSPSVAEDFNCVRGPHEWLSDGYFRQYCKHCPASRRLMEVA